MGTALAASSLTELMNYAERVAKSNFVPPAYKGKPEDALVAMQMGAELGLAPLQSLQNIACINGKPSIYGDAALALVKASKLCEDVREEEVGTRASGDAWGYRCTAIRRGKAPVVYTFTVADAKKAGLWGKAGPWTQYDKRMLQMRARGFTLRDAFPDVLRGLITVEEAGDVPAPKEKVINPVPEPVGNADAPAPALSQPSSGAQSEAPSGDDPTALQPDGVPIFIPGRAEPYAVSADKDAWLKDYAALEAKILAATSGRGKDKRPLTAAEKHQKVLALWETNEPRIVELGVLTGAEIAAWRDARGDLLAELSGAVARDAQLADAAQP